MNAYELRKYFDYNDGELIWKEKSNRKVIIGKQVKTYLSNSGYRLFGFMGKTRIHHRMIFAWHHGYLPPQVDHIDGNPANNRIENLRACNQYQNQANRKANKSNKSGYKNVNWTDRGQCWEVKFRHDGKQLHFGYFKDLELASLVAIEARNKYHKEFANHG